MSLTTQAQKEANKRLQSKKDRIALWLDKDGTKEKIKARAESLNMSLNAYIVALIEKDMESTRLE